MASGASHGTLDGESRTDPPAPSASYSGSGGLDATVAGDPTNSRSLARPSGRLERGDTVARYVVLEEAGRGAMGVVYVAIDPDLERRVAVKILWGSDSRLLAEARALARLSHANVVGVYDVGDADGRLFVAMEYVDGGSVEQWLEVQPRSWTEIVDVFIAAGRGLAAAHEAGIIHRDFKPANVMVADEGDVKVTDFGLAHAVDPFDVRASVVPPSQLAASEEEVAAAKGLQGTPAYMAPELHREEPADEASDQFAFCVALWRCLYGGYPFRGRDAITLMASVVNDERVEPPVGSPAPTSIQRLLDRGLQQDPADRFASMSALVDQLARIRTPSRRIWWLAGGLAGVAAVGGALLRSPPPDPCDGVERTIETVWSASRAESLRDGFARSELPFADRASEAVQARLDVYARQWGADRQKACVERTSSDPVVASNAGLVEHCLERAHGDLEAVVEVLLAAEATTVTNAVQLVYELPELSDCMDPVLASALPVPEDPGVRSQVARIRAELSVVKARRVAGQPEPAEVIEDLATRAEALGFAPLRAEVMMEQAYLRLAEDHDDGARSFEHALSLAVEGNADLVAARVTAELLGLDGDVRGKGERARAWEQVARGYLRRWPEHGRLSLMLEASLSRVLSKQGRFDEAVSLALDAADRADALEDPRAASVHRGNYGMVLMRAGRLEDALSVLTAHVDTVRALYGAEHPEAAWAYNALGVTYLDLGRIEEARSWCFEAVQIYRQIDDHPLERAQALSNLANIYSRRGAIGTARDYAQEALESMRSHSDGDHATRAVLLNNLGSYASDLGNLQDAERYFSEALKMRERLGDTPLQRLLPTANLAEVYQRLGRHDAARRQLEATLALMRDEVPDQFPLAGQIYLLVGATYVALGDGSEARAPLVRAQQLLQAQLGEDNELTRKAAELLATARAGSSASDDPA